MLGINYEHQQKKMLGTNYEHEKKKKKRITEMIMLKWIFRNIRFRISKEYIRKKVEVAPIDEKMRKHPQNGLGEKWK